MYQLEKAVSCILQRVPTSDVSLICERFDSVERLIFCFPGDGRRFLSEASDCPSGTRGCPKDSPEASENSSSAEQTLDVLIYTVMFCTVKLAQTRRLEEERPEEHANTSSFTFILNPAETK